MSATHAHDLLDRQFSSALTRQSILAIALFAVDIYGLNSLFVFNGHLAVRSDPHA
jgi:hypothetical protein